MSSAIAGYLLPTSTTPLPGGLTLTRFIQTILVGISGLDPTLVRGEWQQNDPKNPDVSVNWLAFAVVVSTPDANAYIGMTESEATTSQRHAQLEVRCNFYGPLAQEYADIVRDGFQVQQNLAVLNSGNMGFVSTGAAIVAPDLLNERWVKRIVMPVFLRQEIIRVYDILPVDGAEGTIFSTPGDGTQDAIETPWETPEEEI